jgi:peptide/nickel transport system permease protein
MSAPTAAVASDPNRTVARPTSRARRRDQAVARRLMWIGGTLVGLVVVIALTSPWITPYSPDAASADVLAAPPDLATIPGLIWQSLTGQLDQPVHWFGTDDAGLDIFSRVLSAPRTDLVIAVCANAISLVCGTIIGLLCGYYRNRGTELVMRVSDLIQSFPILISGMILVALAGRNVSNIVLALGLLYTPIYVRLLRVEVMAQKSRGYVESARALGLTELAIARKHVLPNSFAPALIQASVMIGFAILTTAGLSFVGAGVRPPLAEWGLMIALGVNDLIQGQWWPSMFPGFAISLTVFGFAALGNGLERLYAR